MSPQGLYGGAGPSSAGSTRLDAATITRREGSAYAKPRAFCALCLSTPRRRLSSALCRLGMSSRCRLLATLTCAAIGASAESVPTIDAHRAGWKGTKVIASPPRGRRGSSMGRPRSNCGAARRRHARILPARSRQTVKSQRPLGYLRCSSAHRYTALVLAGPPALALFYARGRVGHNVSSRPRGRRRPRGSAKFNRALRFWQFRDL